MYITIPEPECSKCGMVYSEMFQTMHKSGRRCLGCGHEKIEAYTQITITSSDETQWVLNRSSAITF